MENNTATATEGAQVPPAVGMLDQFEQEVTQQSEQIAQGAAAAATDAATKAAQAEAEKAAAQAAAVTVVGFAEMALLTAAPYVQIDPAVRATLSAKMAPVLLKHGVGGELPPWLAEWKEEIDLGLCVAGVGFGVWMQVRAHQQLIEQQQAEEQRQAAVSRGAVGQLDLTTGQAQQLSQAGAMQ